MSYADVQLFSNKPIFSGQKNFTVSEALKLNHLNLMVEANEATTSYNKCGDDLQKTLWVKNLVHQLIRCGGEDIDLNFVLDMFPASDPTRVGSTTWYNRYMCDPDFNIFTANNVTSTVAGGAITFTLLKENHGGTGGALSMPAEGYLFYDKDNMIQYIVTDVDVSVPYAHKITITPTDASVFAKVRVNTGYLIIPAQMVGGCACPIVTNSMNSVGWVQKLAPIKIRRDWRLCVEILKGYADKLQYAITFDMKGNAVDSWMLKEEQDMRLGLRMALNILTLWGTPVTNQSLISGVDAKIDGVHTGFYGIIPSVIYGGGNTYDVRRDRGFDLEIDGEPLFLHQGSRKKTKRFLVWHGQKFAFDMNDSANKLVARTGIGGNEWAAFRRAGAVDVDGRTGFEKLGIRSYDYMGFGLDFKELKAWSDYRYTGSDKWNSSALFIPQGIYGGATENGRRIEPVEFYNYGQGQWTGDYEEFYRDEREITGCDYLSGHATQSLGMAVHCPDQWIFVNSIVPS